VRRYLLVHGLGLSADIWSQLSALLHGEVIARDLPGHGASRSQAYEWIDLWAEISSPVLQEQWGQTVLVLHSFTAALIPEIVFSGIRPAHVVLLEGILHSEDAHWSNEIALMNDVEYQRWLNRFRSVSEMALKSQLVSKQTKNDICIWSEAFKIVQGDALKQMASNLKNRLSGDSIYAAFSKSDFQVTYFNGEKSGVSFPHGLLRLANSNHQILEDCGHFPMIDSIGPLVKYLNEII
jgi:pimeloyl-ACP methyl ester carboxylesterase